MLGKRAFIVVSVIALFVALGYCVLNNLADDDIWDLQELAGLVLLSFLALGSVITMVLFTCSEVIYHWMESRGDQHRDGGNARRARIWYERCLRLDDMLLNNTWKRVVIMGKLSSVYDELGKSRMAKQMTERADSCPEAPPGLVEEPHVSERIEKSWFYKYAFVVVFGLISLVYMFEGNVRGAFSVLIVGISLNAYWLFSDSRRH